MTDPSGRHDRFLRLACVADQSAGATVLHETLVSLFPTATVVRLDTDVERNVPEDVDCAVIDATVNGDQGVAVLRRLRAGGYAGAAVLLTNGDEPDLVGDEATPSRLGARTCSLDGRGMVQLASAITDALAVYGNERGVVKSQALRALRQTQRLFAAGELAMRLQHSLNNPLAALLAEAQLLELEPLPPDHRAAVERIIEHTRRVIDVVRGLDGVGRA